VWQRADSDMLPTAANLCTRMATARTLPH